MENCNICDMCGFVAQTKKHFPNIKKLMTLVSFHLTYVQRPSKEFTRLQSLYEKEDFDKCCNVCGKICKDVFTLQRHIAIVHEERKYKCDECEATFKQQKK